MEFSIMPSKFLNLAMDETHSDSNGNKKMMNPTMATISSLSKSVKRALESETTIIPIYSNSK